MFTPDVQTYLREAVIPLRLSCATGSGWPVVLSLWYTYRDPQIYCATQRSARVISYLEREPRCGFEVASDHPPYCGVRGQAMAEIDGDLGRDVLQQLLIRYLGNVENPLAERLLARSGTEVAIRIKPINLHTWNFSERMRDSVDTTLEKPCPA